MGDYDDIINLPHYEPKRHPRMSMMARAAQFAPLVSVPSLTELQWLDTMQPSGKRGG